MLSTVIGEAATATPHQEDSITREMTVQPGACRCETSQHATTALRASPERSVEKHKEDVIRKPVVLQQKQQEQKSTPIRR